MVHVVVFKPIEALSPVAPLLVTNELDDNQNSFILSRLILFRGESALLIIINSVRSSVRL